MVGILWVFVCLFEFNFFNRYPNVKSHTSLLQATAWSKMLAIL